LSAFQKDFYLVHVHGNNHAALFKSKNITGTMPNVIELTFINKRFAEKAVISFRSKPLL
jgi:hypothetical protein